MVRITVKKKKRGYIVKIGRNTIGGFDTRSKAKKFASFIRKDERRRKKYG